MHCGKPTSDFRKGQVVALKQDGKSVKEISRRLKLPKSTVLDIWKKYEKSENTNNK